eukprot:1157258-Pelagomonas_calceolata.AAC.1
MQGDMQKKQEGLDPGSCRQGCRQAAALEQSSPSLGVLPSLTLGAVKPHIEHCCSETCWMGSCQALQQLLWPLGIACHRAKLQAPSQGLLSDQISDISGIKPGLQRSLQIHPIPSHRSLQSQALSQGLFCDQITQPCQTWVCRARESGVCKQGEPLMRTKWRPLALSYVYCIDTHTHTSVRVTKHALAQTYLAGEAPEVCVPPLPPAGTGRLWR